MSYHGVCLNCSRIDLLDDDEGVCEPCWTTPFKGACRDCWDVVDTVGAEQCDWCAATPEERRKRMRRNWVVFIGFIALCAGLLALAGCSPNTTDPQVSVCVESRTDVMFMPVTSVGANGQVTVTPTMVPIVTCVRQEMRPNPHYREPGAMP